MNHASPRRMLIASVAVGAAVALTVPVAANAQSVVSQGTGRLVTTSLLSSAALDTLVPLKGSHAVNTGAGADVIVDTPLDPLAGIGLTGLRVGLTNLPVFGDTGVIRIGAAGQYARANGDGSSVAFSGTVGSAPGLVGVAAGAVTPGAPIATPSAGSGATVVIGKPSTDPVTLRAEFIELAASASQSTTGTQAGRYRLGSFGVVVGGLLVATPVSTIRPALDTLSIALSTAGVTPPAYPFAADSTMKLTTADLQAAGLGSDLNALPADTDLTQYIPLAVSQRITAETNDYLAASTSLVASAPTAAQPVLRLALTTAQDVVAPVIGTLGSPFQGRLGIALRSLGQLIVNHHETVNGSFSETALRVGLGANGQDASVDLASAAVGPNAGPAAQPTQPTTAATTGAGTGTGIGSTGSGGGGATLAHTGSPLEAQLVPWGTLAFALLGAGFASFSLAANRRRRSAVEEN